MILNITRFDTITITFMIYVKHMFFESDSRMDYIIILARNEGVKNNSEV